MRVAFYLRVSKRDSTQDPGNQRRALEELAARRGWVVGKIYQDTQSGRRGRLDRQEFDQMLRAAARHEFDVVAFWSLDRFSREGIAQTLQYLQLLQEHGVGFYSHQEEFLNTESELVRPILLAILSHFAAFEAGRISERTKAGLDRARARGAKLGRRTVMDVDQVRALRAEMKSVKAIARELGVSESTVWRALRSKQQE